MPEDQKAELEDILNRLAALEKRDKSQLAKDASNIATALYIIALLLGAILALGFIFE